MKRRIRKFGQSVKALLSGAALLLGLALTMVPASAMSCRQSIKETESRSGGLRGWFQHVHENLPAWISRVRPAYQDSDFSIRIISRSSEANSRSPHELLASTIAKAQQLRQAYADIGFSFPRHVHILVDAHQGAAWVNSVSSAYQVVSVPLSDRGPLVTRHSCSFEIPGFFVARKLLRPDKRTTVEANDEAVYMGLPFLSPRVHSIEHTFAVAHEFAHATESPHSHRGALWVEGRADFLSYVVTGSSELIWPRELHQTIINASGRRERVYTTSVRSLRNPLVGRMELLMPDLKLNHANSEFVSHLLFRLDQALGRDRSLALVRWMDALPSERTIPALAPQLGLKLSGLPPRSDTLYVNTAQVSAVRQAVHAQALMILELVREWGEGARLTAEEATLLRQVLADT